jgi:hypothetical protein
MQRKFWTLMIFHLVFELISVTPSKEKWKTHEYWKMQIEQWFVGKSTIRYHT